MSEQAAVAKSRERFVRETAEHQMEVKRDDGLYRHLRFQTPGTSMYWFDLITWPGVLVVSGDCGAFMFSRVRDMFEFFAPSGARGGFEDERWGINPGYWSEKLRAPDQRAARVYSENVFRTRVSDWLADAVEDLERSEADALCAAVHEQLLRDPDGYLGDESLARQRLFDFEYDGTYPLADAWEWDLREYDWQFLWCCWAIVWGIGQYARAEVPA